MISHNHRGAGLYSTHRIWFLVKGAKESKKSLTRGHAKEIGSTVGRKRKKSLTRGYVKDIGSAMGIQSYRGRGTKGLLIPGIAFVTSRYLHINVKAMLSEARVVRTI